MNKFKYLLLTLLIIISMFPTKAVYADSDVLTVAGEGTDLSGTYVGGTGTWADMNTCNGITDYIHELGSVYHSWDMTNFASATSSITNIVVSASMAGLTIPPDCFNQVRFFISIGGTRYYSSWHTLSCDASFATYSTTWATNPATGIAWTTADINGAYYGVTTGSAYELISCIYVTVNYTPATYPSVTTDAASGISVVGGVHQATMNGDITDDGGDCPYQRGFAWGTTSNTTRPASTETPHGPTYTVNWTEGDPCFAEGDFSHTVTGLVVCTTYYYRAYALNDLGWGWGDEQTFTTLCDPNITTIAATYIASSTARLNSLVVTDGGQAADVRFSYGTITGNCTDGASCALGTCNTTTYNATTPWVLNTYTTGQTPYVDVSGLLPGTTYYFCSQIQNDVSCRCGGQLSFTTETGVSAPTLFAGIPKARSISLLWVKGTGSTNTHIQYKTGGYPTATNDGTNAYDSTFSSHSLTGLVPGTTYYFRAWGESGGIYSTSNMTLMITTLAGSAVDDTMPTPTSPTNWLTAPDYTKAAGMPWYSFVNWWADSFQMPRSTMWFLNAVGISIIAGVLAYRVSQKILIAEMAVLVMVGFGTFIGLISGWIIVPMLIIIAVSLAVGERI